MIQFDQYFLNGLKPPTRNFVLVLNFFRVFVDFVLMFFVGFVVVVESFSKHVLYVFVFLRMMFDVTRINEHQSEKSLGIWNLYIY